MNQSEIYVIFAHTHTSKEVGSKPLCTILISITFSNCRSSFYNVVKVIEEIWLVRACIWIQWFDHSINGTCHGQMQSVRRFILSQHVMEAATLAGFYCFGCRWRKHSTTVAVAVEAVVVVLAVIVTVAAVVINQWEFIRTCFLSIICLPFQYFIMPNACSVLTISYELIAIS